ncbi:hypothetical protein [Nonomuraea sp. KM90]|uniref:hypothetical protein n=1 Tax=Nonomuraea sp. KM90 TaxID=3457428 RepID=UPI003FCE083E
MTTTPSPQGVSPDLAHARTVDLAAAPHGRLRITATANLLTGALRCHVVAAQVRGTFTLEPAFDTNRIDPDTTRVTLHYGDELPAGVLLRRHRPDRPLIDHDIQLIDCSTIDASHALAGARTPADLGVRALRCDASTQYRRAPAPAYANDIAAAVIAALAIHWMQRDDLAQLRRAAARHLIERVGLSHQRDTIATLEALIAANQEELAHHRAHLAYLEGLSATHPRNTPGGGDDIRPSHAA